MLKIQVCFYDKNAIVGLFHYLKIWFNSVPVIFDPKDYNIWRF